MEIERRNEYRNYRRTFPGQLKNILAVLCVLTGLFFWFHNRNLWLVIPMGVLAPIAVNLPARKLDLLVAPDELAKRKAVWKRPDPRFAKGWLARYERLVSSAAKGAVLEPPK